MTSSLPGGEFDVLYADPPWRYEAWTARERRSVERHYQTMTLDDLCALPVQALSAPDAVLFLWVTSPKIAEGLRVMTAWGFTYRTCAVWDKVHIGMGYWFRQQHELLFVGVRGSPKTPERSLRVSSILRATRTRHSAKPAIVREWLTRWYPTARKLELFGRDGTPGWTVYGNQVQECLL